MSKTSTPDLTPDVLKRLQDYAELFQDDFFFPRQAQGSGVSLQGLILDGERQSIEPRARRISLPEGLQVKDPEPALQHFLNQSPWDRRKVLQRHRDHLAQTFARPEGSFVIDDTTFPKPGKSSVGVQRRHRGALGKKANCPCAVSVHYVSPKGHDPWAPRLDLPQSGTKDKPRLDQAYVPQELRPFRTQGPSALERLDPVRSEGLPGRVVLVDAGPGVAADCRDGLAQRGLHSLAGVTEEMVVCTEEPRGMAPTTATGGRPQSRHRWAEDSPRPVNLKDLASRTRWPKVTWRKGTTEKPWGHFAWLRVWPASGWSTGECAGAEPMGLLIEQQADAKLKYAFSNQGSEGGVMYSLSSFPIASPWRRA